MPWKPTLPSQRNALSTPLAALRLGVSVGTRAHSRLQQGAKHQESDFLCLGCSVTQAGQRASGELQGGGGQGAGGLTGLLTFSP